MKVLKNSLVAICFAMIVSSMTAQVGIGTTNPDSSAALEISSTDKGLLLPRISNNDILSISNPVEGLMIYNTTTNKLNFYNGSSWIDSDGWSWSCGDDILDVRDSKSYTTVLIGTQCWMAENLNIGTLITGTSNQTDNATIEKYCYNDNLSSECDTYGGLYQWNEMMDYVTTESTQGICPSGWHLPSDAEWCTLNNYVDVGTISCSSTGWVGTDAGGNLKETGISHWNFPNTGAINSSGFTGTPGGYRTPAPLFTNINTHTHIWSSTVDNGSAWDRGMNNTKAQVSRSSLSQSYGFSVRCLMD